MAKRSTGNTRACCLVCFTPQVADFGLSVRLSADRGTVQVFQGTLSHMVSLNACDARHEHHMYAFALAQLLSHASHPLKAHRLPVSAVA